MSGNHTRGINPVRRNGLSTYAAAGAVPQYAQPQQQPQYTHQYAAPDQAAPVAQYATTTAQRQLAAAQPAAQLQYARTLQQIQRQQQQQQTALPALSPAAPGGVDPLTAAFYARMHQQHLQAQQQYQQQQMQQQQQHYQQQLLQQLYEQQPLTPSTAASMLAQTQPDKVHSNQLYTTDQYATFLQQQQQQILQAQRNQMQSEYEQRTAAAASSRNHTTPQYSPSDQVSHVKFSSGNLAYNF